MVDSPGVNSYKVAISDTLRWKVNHGVEGSNFPSNMHCYTHTKHDIYFIIRNTHVSYANHDFHHKTVLLLGIPITSYNTHCKGHDGIDIPLDKKP